jgi:endonuclease I
LLAQIPPNYYSTTEGLSQGQLKIALHDIIKNHVEYPYTSSMTDVWDILKETDRDTINSNNVILFYTGWAVDAEQEYNNGNGWTREHVWAKSHGQFGNDLGAGTDVHHIRPTDGTVNSARSWLFRSNGASDFGVIVPL